MGTSVACAAGDRNTIHRMLISETPLRWALVFVALSHFLTFSSAFRLVTFEEICNIQSSVWKKKVMTGCNSESGNGTLSLNPHSKYKICRHHFNNFKTTAMARYPEGVFGFEMDCNRRMCRGMAEQHRKDKCNECAASCQHLNDFSHYNMLSDSVRLVEDALRDPAAQELEPLAERMCGTRATDQMSPRIVGGVAAQPGEWPWQASIHRHDYEGHVCGGTLLNRRWVLSASHCFELSSNASNYKIVLGSYELSTFNRGQQRNYSVERIINHPNYNTGTKLNDIALIKLKSDADYSNYILPACLPSQDWPAGTITWITGWGEQQGTYDERLQEISVPTIDTATCNQPDWNGDAVADCCMFCAGLRGGGKDSCLGDSGGPVVVENNAGKYEVIGITSWGYGCAKHQHPGVYTKVFNYLDWINCAMCTDL